MLVVLYIGAFVAAFNENIINVAIVDITTEFSVGSDIAQWLVTGYMVVTAVVIALTAFLFKRFTLRSLFFFAGICFIAGEVACFFAPTFPLLLTARLVQAIGSGIFIPIMMNTVLACVPPARVGTYLAIGSAIITVGPAFAPVVSGIVATLFGWRSIFAVPTILTVVLVVLGIAFLRNFAETEKARFDVLSVVLSTIGLTLLVFGLSQIMSNLLYAIAAIVVAIVVLLLFARRQTHLDEPLLKIDPLMKPQFARACILAIIAMMTTFSMSVLLPIYFESSFGATALLAGLLILIPIAINAVIALSAGRIMDRWGEWPLLPIGYGMILVGQAAVAFFSAQLALVPVVVASVVVYAGVGLVMSPAQTSGLKILPGPERSSGVSIMSIAITVAGSLGPSLFVGILANAALGAQALGNAFAAAQALGFSRAVIVAAVIGAIGLAISIPHSLKASKHD